MRLTGSKSFFELDLIDIQVSRLGQEMTGPASIEVAVRSGWQRHRSAALGVMLRADEIEQLIGWLRETGQPRVLSPRFLFDNASLAFDCVTADAEECLLQIKLDWELAPAWHVDPLLPFWVPILTTRRAIAQAADELQHQFKRLTEVE